MVGRYPGHNSIRGQSSATEQYSSSWSGFSVLLSVRRHSLHSRLACSAILTSHRRTGSVHLCLGLKCHKDITWGKVRLQWSYSRHIISVILTLRQSVSMQSSFDSPICGQPLCNLVVWADDTSFIILEIKLLKVFFVFYFVLLFSQHT